MTVYNAARWLSEAVDSLVAQTYADWELVVIENGSVDASPEILASYSDPRIRVVRVAENMGRTPALRHGFDRARGEYIAVLDADDVALSTRLARQIEFLDAHRDVAVVGAWTRRIDEAGNQIGAWTFPTDASELRDRLAYANPIVHSAAMYRAASARAAGGYPAEYPYAQDIALWIRLAQYGSVGMVAEVLACHRTLTVGMTQSKASRVMVPRDLLGVLEEAATRLPLSRTARRRNREERTIASFRYALGLARAGEMSTAAAVAGRALASDPGRVLWNRVYAEALFRMRRESGSAAGPLR